MKLQIFVSKSTLKKILYFICAGIVFINFIFVSQYWKTKEYVPVQAILVEKSREVELGTSSNQKSNVVKYLKYEYKNDSLTYEYQCRTLIPVVKTIGSNKTIYVDGQNLIDFRDPFVTECYIVGMIFLMIFLLFCVKALRHVEE